jgi:hypothetical protein
MSVIHSKVGRWRPSSAQQTGLNTMAGDRESKTNAELIEEINALKELLAARSAVTGSGAAEEFNQPTFSKPMTRREALTHWVAPVVLSVPVAAALRSEAARAGGPPPPSPVPSPVPSPAPPPTVAPAPTMAPRSIPALGAAGAVALGGALAAAGAKAIKDRHRAADKGGSHTEADTDD